MVERRYYLINDTLKGISYGNVQDNLKDIVFDHQQIITNDTIYSFITQISSNCLSPDKEIIDD